MIFLTPHIITNPLEAARLSESKDREFETYKKYSPTKPGKTFYGPDADSSKENPEPVRNFYGPTEESAPRKDPYPVPPREEIMTPGIPASPSPESENMTDEFHVRWKNQPAVPSAGNTQSGIVL